MKYTAKHLAAIAEANAKKPSFQWIENQALMAARNGLYSLTVQTELNHTFDNLIPMLQERKFSFEFVRPNTLTIRW